jgi:hypothetical protein
MVPLANGVPKYVLNLAADLPGNQVPLQPWAEALLKERMETSDTELIEFVCNVNEKDQPHLVGK